MKAFHLSSAHVFCAFWVKLLTVSHEVVIQPLPGVICKPHARQLHTAERSAAR